MLWISSQDLSLTNIQTWLIRIFFYLRIRLPGTHWRALRRSWPKMSIFQFNISNYRKFFTNDYATSYVKLSPTFDKTISLVCASVQFILHVTLKPSRSITNYSYLIKIYETLFFDKKGEKLLLDKKNKTSSSILWNPTTHFRSGVGCPASTVKRRLTGRTCETFNTIQFTFHLFLLLWFLFTRCKTREA